jgi:zinc D-Ala-D-Ala dipeptidase
MARCVQGCAVDLTLCDAKTGAKIDMPSAYDEMTERSHRDYAGGTAEQRAMRDLLRAELERDGFSIDEDEWWHADFSQWKSYPIQDIPFEQL